MTLDMVEIIQQKVAEFNEKVTADEKMSKDLGGVTKNILIDLGGERIFLELKDNAIGIVDDLGDIDMTIVTTPEVLSGIINKDISPMRALLIDRTLKVEASLEDKLRLRKLLE